jgi:hypothetical protein
MQPPIRLLTFYVHCPEQLFGFPSDFFYPPDAFIGLGLQLNVPKASLVSCLTKHFVKE